MTRFKCGLFFVLSILWSSAWGADHAEPRQLWQLIDYVAVDYAGAVQAGTVTSAAEYAEMLEFTATAVKMADTLPPHPQREELAKAAKALQTAVDRKAPEQEVASLANAANAVLLNAYPMAKGPSSAPDLGRGKVLYSERCAGCHGLSGAGDGPAATALDPKPIAFTDAERARSRSLLALYEAISQGVAGTAMPSFASLEEQDRWALAFYISTLSHNQSMRSRGKALWDADRRTHAALPNFNALATATESSLATSLGPENARDVMAYLRYESTAMRAAQGGFALTRQRLRESLRAAEQGDRTQATRLALSAYLDGSSL